MLLAGSEEICAALMAPSLRATGGVGEQVREARTMKLQGWLLALLLLAMMNQSLYYYPQLPKMLASHFGGSGQPIG